MESTGRETEFISLAGYDGGYGYGGGGGGLDW